MSGTQDCPGRCDLQRLALGQASAAEAEALGRHVSVCSGCEQLLVSLRADAGIVVASQARPTSDDDPAVFSGSTVCSSGPGKSRLTEQHSVDEAARQRFEAAWVAGLPEPMEHFLPAPDHRQYRGTLVELVHIELEFPVAGLEAVRPRYVA